MSTNQNKDFQIDSHKVSPFNSNEICKIFIMT